MRRWLGVLSVLAVVAGVLFAAPTAAQAHALLVAISPADGESLEVAPQQVRLEFSEDVQVAATVVELFDGTGRRVSTGSPASENGASRATVVLIPLSGLGRDRYQLRWRSISADDLHPTDGSMVFGVGLEVGPGATSGLSAWDLSGSVAEAVLRWLALLALGTALAALVISRRLSAGHPDDAARRPVLPRARGAMAGGGALFTSLLALLFLGRIAALTGFGTLTGAWELTLRWLVAVAASLAAWLLVRYPGVGTSVPEVPGGTSGWLTPSSRESSAPASDAANSTMGQMALLVVAMTAITSTSHAAAAGSRWALIGGVHTVTTMLWSCGAAAVALAAVPALRHGERRRAVAVAWTFTPIALFCVPVSLISGLVLAGRLVPSVGALGHTAYGQALLVKLGLLGIAMACAGATVALLVWGRGRALAGVAVALEAVALGTVVLAASSVAAIHPASRVVWAPTPQPPPTVGVLSQLVDDLVITANVGPGRPGNNFVTIDVLDTRRPAPEPVVEVRVAIDGEAPLEAQPRGDVEWVAVERVEQEGPVTLRVWADRPGLPTATVSFVWQVGASAGTKIGGAPMAPITAAAAIALALSSAVLAAGYVMWRRSRRRGGQSVPLPQGELTRSP